MSRTTSLRTISTIVRTAIVAGTAALVLAGSAAASQPSADGSPTPQRAVSADLPVSVPTGVSRAASVDFATLDQLMTWAIHDVADTWNGYFDAGTSVNYLWAFGDSGTIQTGCGSLPVESLAAYCSLDDTIYVSYVFASVIYDNFGDMALVTAMAHEFGHNLQAEVGLQKVPGSPALELQADCLAGVYMQVADDRGLLEDGDVYEAFDLMYAIGDTGPTPDPHGTSEQRANALADGYVQGLAACTL